MPFVVHSAKCSDKLSANSDVLGVVNRVVRSRVPRGRGRLLSKPLSLALGRRRLCLKSAVSPVWRLV